MKYAQLIDEPWSAMLALKTAPAIEPMSVAELQVHNKIDSAIEAEYLATLIRKSVV